MARTTLIVLSILALGVFSARAAVVTGLVQDNAAQSNPVANAIVTLAPVVVGGTIYSDTTDALGAYRIANVATGVYRASAAKTGYNASTQTLLNVTNANSTYTQDFTLAPRGAGATITGAVTSDSANGAAIPGAKVLLQEQALIGTTTIDSAFTDIDGKYTIDSIDVTQRTNFVLTVSATDFITQTTPAIAITGVQTVTRNISLVSIVAGKITGKITGDSLKGPALSGAQVILSLRQASGLNLVPVDTVESNASGIYLFNTVTAGQNYQITASIAGYVDATVRHNAQSANTDTVNVVLTKIQTGNLFVKVMKQTDSSAIANAAVAVAPPAGTTLTGNTAAGGIIEFADLATGLYGITASAAGFNPQSVASHRLLANVNDTVKIYLTASAQGTKVLTGIVTDSATKAGLANVRVVLQIPGAGVAGGTLTLFDSTDATGKYSIVGIPVTVFQGGSVTATRTDYRSYTNAQVTLGQTGQADTAKLNFIMVRTGTGIVLFAPKATNNAIPDFGMSKEGMLRLNNINDIGIVKVFGMNGRLLYQSAFNAHVTNLTIPSNMVRSGSACIVSLTQKNSVYCKQIIMP